MGFSLTGAHVIFFIATVIVASTVSGVFIAVTLNVSNSFSDKGDRIQEQLDTDFTIINDPDNIPLASENYTFYLKNIGGKTLTTTTSEFQVFIDGEIIGTTFYSFNRTSLPVSEVAELKIWQSKISSGDRTLRVVGSLAVEDEFTFTI